jgi:hypothetical protein
VVTRYVVPQSAGARAVSRRFLSTKLNYLSAKVLRKGLSHR